MSSRYMMSLFQTLLVPTLSINYIYHEQEKCNDPLLKLGNDKMYFARKLYPLSKAQLVPILLTGTLRNRVI